MKVTGLVVVASLCFAACGGSGESPSSTPGETPSGQTPTPSEVVAPPPAPPAAAGPVVTDTGFELRAAAPGPFQVGQASSLSVTLTPRSNYHVNQEYPIHITLRAPAGVALQKSDLSRTDAAEFGEQVARFNVPFTPSAAGQHTVDADVDFAVCTPENCMPDRRTVRLALAVQ